MVAALNTYTMIEQRGVVRFLWAKNMDAKDIHKEMLPMYGEHCLSRQAVMIGCRSSGGQLSKTNIEPVGARVVPTATKRILRRRFPGTCEMVGQVFKFVRKLC
jgi:hypothetical protein